MFTQSKFLLVLILITCTVEQEICSSKEVHALILARGGSKGIPNKNLQKINGDQTILAKSIKTLQESNVFAAIWVSTDNENIKNEAIKYGSLVHSRAAFYAQDETTSLASVQEFLEAHATITRIALFQCTSVFLNKTYILEAIQKFEKVECVFSVTRNFKLRWKESYDKIIPLNFDPSHRPRRQDWNGELIENGMFYFATRKLIAQNAFQNERCAIVDVEQRDSLELDTMDDLEIMNCMLNKVKM